MVEPWLRGTLPEVDAVRRQALHALELAGEDAERWCAALDDRQIHARPGGIASVSFHLRHIAASLDRLLTYADGVQLSARQHKQMADEHRALNSARDVLHEFREGLRNGALRLYSFSPSAYEEVRLVGRDRLPTTLGGLLVHCAEHTQRHIGQAITTAQIVISNEPFSSVNDVPGQLNPE